jgi:hypothetical protein
MESRMDMLVGLSQEPAAVLLQAPQSGKLQGKASS